MASSCGRHGGRPSRYPLRELGYHGCTGSFASRLSTFDRDGKAAAERRGCGNLTAQGRCGAAGLRLQRAVRFPVTETARRRRSLVSSVSVDSAESRFCRWVALERRRKLRSAGLERRDGRGNAQCSMGRCSAAATEGGPPVAELGRVTDLGRAGLCPGRRVIRRSTAAEWFSRFSPYS